VTQNLFAILKFFITLIVLRLIGYKEFHVSFASWGTGGLVEPWWEYRQFVRSFVIFLMVNIAKMTLAKKCGKESVYCSNWFAVPFNVHFSVQPLGTVLKTIFCWVTVHILRLHIRCFGHCFKHFVVRHFILRFAVHVCIASSYHCTITTWHTFEQDDN